MKTENVKVPWEHGLHMLPATIIVRVAGKFHSSIRLRLGERVAEATSVLGLVILCATLNSTITVEVDGDDESEALRAVAACFSPDDAGLR